MNQTATDFAAIDVATHEALREAIEVVGSQAALASEIRKRCPDPRASKVAQGHVSNWVRAGRLPAEYCAAVEAATAARGRRVSRHRLRPDLFPSRRTSPPRSR